MGWQQSHTTLQDPNTQAEHWHRQSGLKYLLYIPEITHPISASQKTPCPHIYKRELAIDIRFLQELSLLFTSTSSLFWSFNVCICYAAFEALRNSGVPPGKNKNILLPKLYCISLRLKIPPFTLSLLVRYRRVKYFTLRSPLSKVSKNFLHPEKLKLKEVLYFNVSF